MDPFEKGDGTDPDEVTLAVPDSGETLPQRATAAESRIFLAGDLVAERYRILRFLAEGGMGEVYEAEDLDLHTRVALKTIRSGLSDRVGLDRFRREIQLARKVSHPNVCRIYDLGYHRTGTSDVMFLTMELLVGETLAQHVQRTGPMASAEALPIVRQIAAALEAAHLQGIVHRDLKTGNVILVPPVPSGTGTAPTVPSRSTGEVRAVVVDFGLARPIDPGESVAQVSQAGAVVGTPAYMAPEQLEGQALSPATDVYALGLVMYNMVTAQLPFSGSSPLESALKRLRESPSSPRVHVANLDPKWETAILRCLERDPRDRFASAADVVRAIEGEKVPTGARRKRLRQRSAAVALLSLLAMLTIYLLRPDRNLEMKVQPPAANLIAQRAGLPGPPKTLRRSIAVLGFKNLSGNREVDWLSTALAEMLGSELAAGEVLRVISGEDVARVKMELSLKDTATLAGGTLARIRAQSNSDYVVLGSYLATGPPGRTRIRVDLVLQETTGERNMTAIIGNGREEELSDLVTSVAANLRGKLEIGSVLPADARAIQAALPSRPEAIRHYSSGINLLRSFDATGAREQLEQAVLAEPAYALAHSALAAAWSALGYDENATAAAKKAFELSQQLPREERLAIQGSYYETAKVWEKAIETYRILWQFAPDNSEYGLRLAAVQIAGGEAKGALAVVEALRALPPPLNDDPRIDLTEAAARHELGDPKQAVLAARRGADKARKRGLSLVLAQARLIESEALETLGEMEQSKAAAEEARRTYSALGERRGIAASLTALANLLSGEGNFDSSRQMYQEALAANREIGNRRAVAASLHNVGKILYQQGDLTGARRNFEEALEIRRAIADRRGTAGSLNNIGAILYDQGNFAEARRVHEEVLTIRRAIGDRQGVAVSLNNIANVLSDQDDLSGSMTMYQESMLIRRAVGDKQGVAVTLSNMANVLQVMGKFAESGKLMEESLRIKDEIGYKRGTSLSLSGLAAVLYYRGEIPGAKKKAEEAVALARELGDQSSLAYAQMNLGIVLQGQGDVEGARLRYEEAIAIQNKLGEKPMAIESGLALLDCRLRKAGRRRQPLPRVEQYESCSSRRTAIARPRRAKFSLRLSSRQATSPARGKKSRLPGACSRKASISMLATQSPSPRLELLELPVTRIVLRRSRCSNHLSPRRPRTAGSHDHWRFASRSVRSR